MDNKQQEMVNQIRERLGEEAAGKTDEEIIQMVVENNQRVTDQVGQLVARWAVVWESNQAMGTHDPDELIGHLKTDMGQYAEQVVSDDFISYWNSFKDIVEIADQVFSDYHKPSNQEEDE